ncbi:MAG TPA: undecaprenyl/decaprenyl-phosphate alpha-N-acetylglucosaminyl 1-phosphate transferase [Crenotrichaceae bacterium]|nr:undecaprenyl/decaprenyl-phosphate alpha-N-acetylglucosaminyl 1-phosphate transferase [Crenotrichaceae bacterium]
MKIDLSLLLGLITVSYVISLVVTRYMTIHHIISDIPNTRSSHKTPTPRAGGLGIFIVFIFVSIFFWLYNRTVLPIWFYPFVLSTLLIGSHSLFDDISERSAIEKLLAQVIAAAIVISSGLVIELPFGGPWLNIVVTTLWIVGMTNATNFMDGLDGLVSGIFSLALVFFCLILGSTGHYDLYVFSLTLIAGLMGFLIYNFPPAIIFMGDVGSCLLGFVYSVMVVIMLGDNHSPWVMLASVLVVFNLLFDIGFTIIRRLLRGDNVMQAHRSHLFQLMNRLGYRHLTVSLCYLGVTFVQGMLALWVLRNHTSFVWLIILLLLLIHFVYATLVISAAKRNKLSL